MSQQPLVSLPSPPPAHEVAQSVSDAVAQLTPDQARYLAERIQGARPEEARERSGVSIPDWKAWHSGNDRDYQPPIRGLAWCRLEAHALTATHTLGPELARRIYSGAQGAIAGRVVTRALATGPIGPRDRDLATLARLAHEVAGVVGRSGGATVAVQVNVGALAWQLAQGTVPEVPAPAREGAVPGTSRPVPEAPDADTGAPQ